MSGEGVVDPKALEVRAFGDSSWADVQEVEGVVENTILLWNQTLAEEVELQAALPRS